MKFKESNKFSVGDKVRLIDYLGPTWLPGFLGKVGTIVRIGGDGYENKIELDDEDLDDNIVYGSDNEIEHATIANTAITRKLYPNYEEDGDKLIVK